MHAINRSFIFKQKEIMLLIEWIIKKDNSVFLFPIIFCIKLKLNGHNDIRKYLTRVNILPVNRPDRIGLLDLVCGWEFVDFNSGLYVLFGILVGMTSSLSDTMHWVDKRFDVADADFEVWKENQIYKTK
jgi:hypothetical protein